MMKTIHPLLPHYLSTKWRGGGGVGDGGLILNFDVLFEVSAYSRVRGRGLLIRVFMVYGILKIKF